MKQVTDQNLTPMMRQYLQQKERHPDAILLFRMGDFYEMFFEDAKKASKILDIALTTRDRNKDESVPLCGFPHHAASGYITKLLAAGERVAVCDQVEDPRHAKGIVRREVTRVLTPGLTEDSNNLKAEENHYVVSLWAKGADLALAAFDLSTGDLLVTQTSQSSLASQELRRLDPKEVLVPGHTATQQTVRALLDDSFYLHTVEDWMSDPRTCSESLRDQYGVQNLEGFGLSDDSPMTVAAGAIINYVRQTRATAPVHIKPPKVYHLGNYMVLDQSTLKNLEIFRNAKDGSAAGSLVRLIDRTCTAMGARLIRQWLSYPLLDVQEITTRSQTVEKLTENAVLRTELRDVLKEMADLERIAGKISLKSANPRDLVQLRYSAEKIPVLIKLLDELDLEAIAAIRETDDLSYVAHAIESVLVDSPPLSTRDGGFIRDGYSEELDELRNISRSGKQWIAGIEAREREAAGIPNLRVGYNRVFGYYIEVTRAHQSKVPAHYLRKQTLVNAERYVTEELKEYELKVLNSQDRMFELEEEIFDLLRTKLIEVIPRIQETASAIATLDVFISLAEVAMAHGYVRPDVSDNDEIRIIEGRHPVVETFEHRERYVPNDVLLNRSTDQILIITGPNMAGKSTYLRQCALVVIMAQMGSMVPAKEAHIGVVDRIFTRIGAADYLAFGQSTFMVEMNETAEILHNASERSLILLDEVGRGTSTFDGLSIAWAVTEYLHDKPGASARTLFATHYHELVDISRIKERVRNYNVAVKEWGGKVVFLRKIVPGGCSRSYGIQVAGLAGIPDSVIARAREILSGLEKNELDLRGIPVIARGPGKQRKRSEATFQHELFGNPGEDIVKDLEELDLNTVTPLEALNLLATWKKRIL